MCNRIGSAADILGKEGRSQGQIGSGTTLQHATGNRAASRLKAAKVEQ